MNESRLEGTANGTSNGHTTKAPVNGPQQQAAGLAHQWATDPRWRGTERTYSAADVVRLRGSVQEERTLSRLGAQRLWRLLHEEDAEAIVVFAGGIIPEKDIPKMKAIGIREIFLPGTPTATAVDAIRRAVNV